MCGIAGFHVKDPSVIKKHSGVEFLVNELFMGIEKRGKHATGFVSVGFDGKVVLDKAPKEASEFIKDRERIPVGVRTVLLHTRWATLGTQENQENNHPVVYGSCFATHNGHIDNHAEVFSDLDLTRNAEVDSSCIAAAASYHGIGELEDVQSTLQAMLGPMACAIIDPVNNPGRLILAKGASSPLWVVDTPKFIVWASTKDTIKDAWSKVLGTPPADKKFESIGEGNVIIVDNTEVIREKFTVKRRPFVSRTSEGSGASGGNLGSNFGFGRRTQIAPTADTTPVVSAKEAIAEFIKAGGTARHFDAHNNGEYGEDDFQDVTGSRKWFPCWGCGRLILEQDRTKSEWGTICIDCATATKREITRAKADDWPEDDTLAGTDIPRISPGDRDALEVWSDHEIRIHREVIEELSKACGSFYSPQAIEFLCFLTTPEYREVAGSAVHNLINTLRDAYEEAYVDVVSETWEGYGAGTACEVPQERPLLEAGETNRFCFTHNLAYKEVDSTCQRCKDEAQLDGEARLAAMLDAGTEDESEETPAPSTDVGVYLPWERGRDTILARSEYARSSSGTEEGEAGNASDDGGGEVIELPRCGKCGTFVLRATEESCVVCRESSADDPKPACLSCTTPDADFVVEYAHKTYAYCRSCYFSCGKLMHNAKDRTVNLCHNDTNHMLKDGMRVCHIHARNQSEVLSDTTLRKRGATLTEVQ